MIKRFYKSLAEYQKPKAWLTFYFDVKVPLGCLGILAEGIEGIISEQTLASFLSAGLGLINITLFLAVMAKTNFSYKIMIFVIALESIGLATINLGESGYNVYPLIGLVYFLLNLLYFSKRKDFFRSTCFSVSSSTKEYVNNSEKKSPETNMQEEITFEGTPQTSKLIQTNGVKITYCKKCGHPIDNITKKCTGCGKQFFSFKRIFINSALVISVILNITVITLFIFLDMEYSDTKELLEIDREALEEKNKKIEYLEKENYVLSDEYKEARGKAYFLDEHICFTTVTGSGYRYHKYGCYHLDNRDTYYWFIEDARREGYSACNDCYYN